MTTNNYFNLIENVPEQTLFDSLMSEAIQMHGTDVLYIKRDVPELDAILREPKFSTFNDTYTIEMYAPDGGVNSNDNFLMQKYGWMTDNSLDLVVSIRRWEIEVEGNDSELSRPREGDLIYVGDSNSLNSAYINTIYEIKNVRVGNDDKFQFGTNYVYTLVCQVYTPSHDDFDTNVGNLDAWLNDNEDETEINDALQIADDDIVVTTSNPFGDL